MGIFISYYAASFAANTMAAQLTEVRFDSGGNFSPEKIIRRSWVDLNKDTQPMTHPWDERYIYLIFMVNVGIYNNITIHRCYGLRFRGLGCFFLRFLLFCKMLSLPSWWVLKIAGDLGLQRQIEL